MKIHKEIRRMDVLVENNNKISIITINRPEVRNAVDRKTADQLVEAFLTFEKDDSLSVAVLCGTGGHFCAGADLKAVAQGLADSANRLSTDMSEAGPMGPSRLILSKPVIAAISGYAVAGGLELACWCDLRVAERNAILGVFCRRFGVPLIDGGTQRLPRLIGVSRALDLILTGRPVEAEEALSIGLVNRVVEPGTARVEAERLAAQIAGHPQVCMRSDRNALYRGLELPLSEAMALEFQLGMNVIMSGETVSGAQQFSAGKGRHGRF
jgi:enoyl-CoA hydratase